MPLRAMLPLATRPLAMRAPSNAAKNDPAKSSPAKSSAVTSPPLKKAPTKAPPAGKNSMAKKGKAKADKKASKAAGKVAKGSAAEKMFKDSDELRHTVASIEKQFGEGSIMPLGTDNIKRIEGIPTGSLSLDIALGGQGIPKGRIIEIYGPESSGKTTLALHVIAQPKKRAASQPSSTPNMHSIQAGRKSWASTSKRYSSASRATAKRRCRSPRCSSNRTRSTSS